MDFPGYVLSHNKQFKKFTIQTISKLCILRVGILTDPGSNGRRYES